MKLDWEFTIIYQGAVIGPEEFFEGLKLGTHHFIEGTLGWSHITWLTYYIFYISLCCSGGIAGMGAKVTGVLGNAVATLTFNKEFQEQRQEQESFGQAVETFSKVFLFSSHGNMVGIHLFCIGCFRRSNWCCCTACQGSSRRRFHRVFKGCWYRCTWVGVTTNWRTDWSYQCYFISGTKVRLRFL